MRHKFLTFFAFPVAVLVVIVVIAVAASSGDSIGSSQTADLATCQSHHAVSGGQWAQIAKDPGSYKGQCVEVYGQIVQFDDNTGPGSFRAEAGAAKPSVSYGFADFPTSNVIFSGDKTMLKPLVEGDLFRADVTIGGSETYDTAVGGATSAPVLRVDSIAKTGHLAS